MAVSMNDELNLENKKRFERELFSVMQKVNPAVGELAFYEFVYGLNNLTPVDSWNSIVPESPGELEKKIRSLEFFRNVQSKPIENNKIVLDASVAHLTRMLFVGLVLGKYEPVWVQNLFTFDVRGFFFLVRTEYFPREVKDHFGSVPYKSFEKGQAALANKFEIGYRDYQLANREIDSAFNQFIHALIAEKGTPILLTVAGPTAAGKTEIVGRLSESLINVGLTVTSLEMDNFGKDREYRDTRPAGRETVHFDLFLQAIKSLLKKEKTEIPRYDFYTSISSHDQESNLRAGKSPIWVEPADIIFLEGNFPFHIADLAPYLGIKIVYLADDDVRLRRKWKRDIDYRKKYDPINLMNRFFKTQFIRSQEIYLPLMKVCDVVVDTSAANLWVVPELQVYFKVNS